MSKSAKGDNFSMIYFKTLRILKRHFKIYCTRMMKKMNQKSDNKIVLSLIRRTPTVLYIYNIMLNNVGSRSEGNYKLSPF